MRRRIPLAGMLLVVAIPSASLPVGTVDFIDVDDCAGRVAIEPRECEEAVVAQVAAELADEVNSRLPAPSF